MRIEWRAISAAIALLLTAAAGAWAQDSPRGLSVVHEGGRAGFWGDAGESIEVYYEIIDFVRAHGVNKTSPKKPAGVA